ncbi:DHA2 family efflux MFS transporter permease subunit [Rhodococcus olei]|uniref:DHA2 family efflux MFS transporter permease subunit n=1 Tax=Rhodococcus olei TaxID=2161675 RepID=A0ABP8NXB2_9NOCA
MVVASNTSPYRRRWWALAALAVAMLTIGLDTTILIVALPTLAVDLHAGTEQLQWFASSYTLVMAAVLLPAGAIGDRVGRKRLLVTAMALFGLASVACAYADTAGRLVAARSILGFAAAVMMPMSMAVLPVLFPDKREQARALSVWVTATAIGLPLGPLVGGWLLRSYWWGSVFLINVPLVVLGLVAVAVLVPESRSHERLPFDLPGALLSSLGLLALTYGLTRAGTSGWTDATTLAALAAGTVALAAFAVRQRTATHPLIDPALFGNREFTWGATLATAISLVMFGLFFALPQLLQSVQGNDALATGVRLLPLIAGLAAGARAGDALSGRCGPGAVAALGFATLAAAAVIGTVTRVDTGYPVTATWLTLAGAGLGLALPTAMAAAVGALSEDRAGSGSALVQALRQAGGTIGVAVLGTVLNATYRAHLDTGPLPEPLAARAREGVTAATEIARTLNLPMLARSAADAFVSGLDTVLWVTAAVSAGCAVVAALALSLRPAPPTADAHPDRERLGT